MTNQLLLKEIEKGSSFVSSPLSFHLTLSLVAAGSTGKTSEQLLSFLVTEYLGTQSAVITYCQDYAACRGSLIKQEKEVSLWAERKTGGLIKEVLPPGSVDNDVALILANAIYFKGAWDQKFDAPRTELGDFHLLNGQIVQVPFLAGLGFEELRY
ncbi:hypothetical protein POTOM_015644 [Populus tomentosa]|uniref:Serpin domain-containing protein n=1 Tax=Populus tomentosa TaxID=118781 RepID=A0A8X8CXA1_POPTO|nr:hypothetical protein POTOM_015644 [Populus tomentosa]